MMSFSSAAAMDEAALKAKLEDKVGLTIESVRTSPVNGLYEITTNRGLFYVSEDGGYLLQARIFNVNEGMRNETEAAMSKMRSDGVEQFANAGIEFKAEDEKYVISVFTDTTCGYCRKLHNEMDAFNDEGITVRYLAFPRAGLNSQAYNDMVSVWCAENPQQAMTEAKAGQSVATASCENSVAEQFTFAQKIGVNGTPNIVLPNGDLIRGYQPADVVARTLKNAE
nr:bifunctional protein-disulfide isomerase/oxidoreductase DsbC [Alteromonas halophila]